jgi:hypothetical protein
MSQLFTLDHMAEAIGAAWQPPFRGEIYDYGRKLDLQNGYAVKGLFKPETVPHLFEPFRAVRDPWVRLVSIAGAVQTVKSLMADIVVPYWIEHDPGDVLWLLEDDKKAREYADRAITLIRSIPTIAALLEDVDRSDKTKTCLKFRHMKVLMAGLNAGNVQSLSWRYVIIDETWLHPFDGLIRQGKDRTKQYPDTHKIILIGQGGVEDDDHDTEHKQTDQRELHYACPQCGKHQPFELSRQRPADFPIDRLRGTYAGLSYDTNETTRPGGRQWSRDAVEASAHHRCYFCDFRIEDRPEVRRRLADTYRYFPAGVDPNAPGALKQYPFPKAVGFHWPGEASVRVSFGYLVWKYLKAKQAGEEQGYKLPLQEFYQKDRGLSWNDLLEGEYRASVREEYDARAEWSEEAFRPMIIDCQRDLKKFFYSIFSVSLAGEVRELERGEKASWEELAKAQKALKVKDQHVLVDCGYRMTDVLRECVQRGHVGSIKMGGKTRKLWLCWTGMKGSGQELFKHEHPKTGVSEYRIYSPRKFYDTNVGTKARQPRSPWYEWSNLHCKDLLRARRDQEAGIPKFLTLVDTLPATDQNSYFAQMRSEKRIEKYSARMMKQAIWIPVKETRPNHFWDIGSMLMAFMGIVGIIGAPEGQAEDPAEAKSPHQPLRQGS